MKILGLYNNDCALDLFRWLTDTGNEVILWKDRLEKEWCRLQRFDLCVSYTYRFILTEDILEALGKNAVNIPNSLLPWTRGADPNLWSIAERTPRGVTLHYMEAGLDRGCIIAQELVDDGDDETLSSSYGNLDSAAKRMFQKAFRYYDFWPSMKKQPLGDGSYHAGKDGREMKSVIDTYHMSVSEFRSRLDRYEIRKQK